MSTSAKASREDSITIDFGTGVTVTVDLSKIPMSDSQRSIVDQLLSVKPYISITDTNSSAASAHLSKDDFEEIRGLKATLGGFSPQGLICDFSLKCVAV